MSSRKLHTINQDAFQTDLTLEFELLSQCECVNDVVMLYDRAITITLDKHAPVKVSVRKSRPRHPWYNHDIYTARRIRRRYERKWRKTRLETDRQQYVDQRMVVNNLIDNAKQTYFRNEFQVSDTKDVFKKVNFLLNKTAKVLPPHESPKKLGDDFAGYYSEKVKKIYQSIASTQVNLQSESQMAPPCSLSEFDRVSDQEVLEHVMKSPAKSCLLDHIPTWFMKQNVIMFVPVIADIINISLSSGIFPGALKHAIITQQSLNASELKNYRPVSNIPYLSKIIEKFAINNINRYIRRNFSLRTSQNIVPRPLCIRLRMIL